MRHLLSFFRRNAEGGVPLIFAGSASRRLTAEIARHLGGRVGLGETVRFSEGTLFVRVLENVRGRDVYVVQSTVFPANDALVELLFWLDALKRASAASVTAVVPYFAYAKGDKKDEPRVSIRARVCADAIEAAGADRVVTMDLHAPQIQGFFRVPVDDLYAISYLCEEIRALGLPDLLVVSPDAGFAKKARRYAGRLGAPLAIADKMRRGHDERAEVVDVIGDVGGANAVIVDDVVFGGATLIDAADALLRRGARSVHAAVTHAALSADAVARIEGSRIRRLMTTDTIETQPVPLPRERISVVSVAPLFAEAIRRIHGRASISVLFEDEREPGRRLSRT
ncbi:MAG: ribose-phosphate diphosphokinase [Actinomycetota bacterium]|nr:ribose-phosphate diphosphokinase [Actinomycetota bacterium]